MFKGIVLVFVFMFCQVAFAAEPMPPNRATTLKRVFYKSSRAALSEIRIERPAGSYELTLFIDDKEIGRIYLYQWMDRAKFICGLEALSDATRVRRALEADGKGVSQSVKEVLLGQRLKNWRVESVYAQLRDELHGRLPASNTSALPTGEIDREIAQTKALLVALPFFFEVNKKVEFTTQDDFFNVQLLRETVGSLVIANLSPSHLVDRSQKPKFIAVRGEKILDDGNRVVIEIGAMQSNRIGFIVDGVLIAEMHPLVFDEALRDVLLVDAPNLIEELGPLIEEMDPKFDQRRMTGIMRLLTESGRKSYRRVMDALSDQRKSFEVKDAEVEGLVLLVPLNFELMTLQEEQLQVILEKLHYSEGEEAEYFLRLSLHVKRQLEASANSLRRSRAILTQRILLDSLKQKGWLRKEEPEPDAKPEGLKGLIDFEI